MNLKASPDPLRSSTRPYPVLVRRHPETRPEAAAQMRLIEEAAVLGHLAEAEAAVCQQLRGALQAVLAREVARSAAYVSAERALQVAGGQAQLLRQLAQTMVAYGVLASTSPGAWS